MDLGKKYAQLFEGKLRSNDKTLLEANEVPNIQELLSGYIDSIEVVAESIRDLEQEVAGGLEMYEEESGDYRVSQLMNQASRYCQSAEKNLDALQRMLKRKKDILG
jgi:hypothetical protein